jgi:hypothetical protein
MAFTFLFFILTAAVFTICAVYLFPVSGVSGSSEIIEEAANNDSWGNRIVFFTVGEFTAFFKTKYAGSFNFCFYDGFSARKTGEKGRFSGYLLLRDMK